MSKIELHDVRKTYGDVVAVDDLTVSFEEGAYTMILGPSGSGKSTALRMIAGLERPTRGDVVIDGEVVTNAPPQDRRLSMVFQNLALWDHKSVRENIGFGLRMEGVGEQERLERVEEIATLLQIEDKLEENPAALSGGQQQRVALGRSLVRRPEVVLLDEPLSSLDERLRLKMRTELRRIQRETGTTFIHVTHSQEDAMTVADEILLFDAGRPQQFGDPLELYHEPANTFVADFIGTPSMNFFTGSLTRTNGRTEVELGNVELPLPENSPYASLEQQRLRIGVRPESLAIVDGRVANGRPTVSATVTIVETFGDYNWYYLDVGGEEFVLKSAREDVMATIGEGDHVTVAIDPAALHLFDAETGRRISV